MDMEKALRFMDKYEICPECGSDKVGNGQGKLIIDEDYFHRECKCGWRITLNENGEEIKKNNK